MSRRRLCADGSPLPIAVRGPLRGLRSLGCADTPAHSVGIPRIRCCAGWVPERQAKRGAVMRFGVSVYATERTITFNVCYSSTSDTRMDENWRNDAGG